MQLQHTACAMYDISLLLYYIIYLSLYTFGGRLNPFLYRSGGILIYVTYLGPPLGPSLLDMKYVYSSAASTALICLPCNQLCLNGP